MKLYKLLKDAPFAKKGTVFTNRDDLVDKLINEKKDLVISKSEIINFDEWFREIKPEQDDDGTTFKPKYNEYYFYFSNAGYAGEIWTVLLKK